MAFARAALHLTAALAVSAPSLVAAQAAPPPPRREELQRGAVQPPPPPERAARVTVADDIERAPCPLADPRFAAITVPFLDIRFDGLRVISPDELRPAWSEYVGKRLPLATVCEIRDRAATILRRKGYLAAVQVPAQRIGEDGVVRFDVLMARLVRIQVRGDAGRAQGMIAGQLAKLQEQPVFNTFDAERYLLLVEDIPGYDARLTLRAAGTAPGEVIGEVTVNYTPFQFDVNVQNLGSRDVGRFGGIIRAQINGVTGLADTTTFAYFNTFDWSEQHVVQAAHSFRLGNEGLTLGGDFTYAWTRPDLGPGSAFRTRTLIATLRGSYPLIRSQTRNLSLSGGLDLANQRVRFGSTLLTEDKLRVLFGRLDLGLIDPKSISSIQGYSAGEPRWRLAASVEARQGVSILGGSQSCGPAFINCQRVSLSKPEADPTAFVLRAQAQAEVRPTPGLTLSVAPRAQYSSRPLIAFEEFSAGTYTVGRGYDSGALTGDSGVGVQTEVRVGSLIPRSVKSWAFQPFAFFDAAWVWNRDRVFPPYAGADPHKLFAAGGGVRAAWGNRARIDAYLAAPLRRAGLNVRKGDVRALVSLTVKLLPWTR